MLEPTNLTPIPELTRQVAQAAFPQGSLVMILRDQLGPIFADDDFVALYPPLGQPLVSPLLPQDQIKLAGCRCWVLLVTHG